MLFEVLLLIVGAAVEWFSIDLYTSASDFGRPRLTTNDFCGLVCFLLLCAVAVSIVVDFGWFLLQLAIVVVIMVRVCVVLLLMLEQCKEGTKTSDRVCLDCGCVMGACVHVCMAVLIASNTIRQALQPT